jgi:predicted TIM-barrel fold metal-dependent hydrolase
MNIHTLLEIHEAAGFDLAVVSSTLHYLQGRSEDAVLAGVQRSNEYIATLQQQHANRVVGFASSVPGGGEPMWRDLERSIKDYGLKGVLINSSHHGHYPDEDQARTFFELATALDIPVFVHAPSWSFGEECMRMYRLVSSVGRANDECLSLARLIVRGIWEQFPTLKLVGAHLGGGICEVIGRMNYAYELQEEAFFLGPYEPMLIKHPPLHYLKMMYLDTVSYHEPALMCAINTVGADHMLLGADAPPLWPLLPRAHKLVEELPIPQDQKDGILGLNALNLMNLAVPTP